MIYLLANTLDGQDGPSRSGMDVLCHLLELGHDVTVVSRNRCALPRWLKGKPGSRVRWVTSPGPLRTITSLGASPRRWLSSCRALARTLRHRAVAAAITRLSPAALTIHNAFPVPGAYTAQVLRRARRRVIVVRSSPEVVAHFLRRSRALTTSGVAAELARAHALAFVSPQIQEAWGRLADLTSIPQWVLPNTCREDEAAAVLKVSQSDLRAGLGLPQQRFVAVCVGFVGPVKGQDTLVEALPGMLRIAPDLLVVLVGDDTTPWAVALKERVHRLGLSGHVRFAGQQKNPYAFIRAADLMIHPARAEGQGIVILEAMLLRIPVLASDAGGIPSCITHGESGWLVPPDDPGALLQGFRALVSDPELRRRMADRAEQVYWERFSRRQYRRRFEGMLQSVLRTM
jgi:glycosyltransferase involved in cell wall biosynthesis